ncbi:MAG: PP2C family serine/threonine-protein phosphatase [Rhizobiaceae bacterium]
MSPKISVIDCWSLAGSARRANEDTFGSNPHCAFVIDGATGLGDEQQLEGEASDAAWLASYARNHLVENLDEPCSLHLLIRNLSRQMRLSFFELASEKNIPRYAWPTASFALLYGSNDKLTFAGLGDCTLYIESNAGVQTLNPLKEFATVEADHAAHHLQKSGGFSQQKNLLSDPDTLATLRQIRSLQNTSKSGVWTLGLEPEAADHLRLEELDLPSAGVALLCSDGFSALVNDYRRYTAESLMEAATTDGLQLLMDELRHIETSIDPQGTTFPRFKQSDDATAVLVSWSS